MPLLLLCGFPSSGKTTRAKSVVSCFKEIGRQTVIVSDHTVSPDFDRDSHYGDAYLEKELRGQLLSTIQRKLSKTKVVIVDSLNYIKSVRYELYCAAKAAQTTFAVLYCQCSPEQVIKWNTAYSELVLNNLIDRFEVPDAANRWDSPLIVVTPEITDIPFEAIDKALFKSKPAKPNKATLATPVAPTHVSYDIDKCTLDIIRAFKAHIEKIDEQPIDSDSDFSINVPSSIVKIRCRDDAGLVPSVMEADLQRHGREFIAMFRTKTHLQASSEAANIPQLFAAFLESRLFSGTQKTNTEA